MIYDAQRHLTQITMICFDERKHTPIEIDRSDEHVETLFPHVDASLVLGVNMAANRDIRQLAPASAANETGSRVKFVTSENQCD